MALKNLLTLVTAVTVVVLFGDHIWYYFWLSVRHGIVP